MESHVRRAAYEAWPQTYAWAGKAFAVYDPTEVGRAVSRSIARRSLLEWDGGELRAAEPGIKSKEIARVADRFGLSYPVLHRLAHGKTTVNGRPAVASWRTAERLRRGLRPDEWRGLERHLFAPRTRRAQKRYAAYVEREIARMRGGRRGKHNVGLTGELETVVQDFRDAMRRIGALATRVELGILRALDPVTGWRELLWDLRRDDELTAMVRTALKREEMLIRREHAMLEREERVR